MLERLRRFRDLDPDARRLFLRASTLLLLIALSLRLRGFRATQLALQRHISNPRSGHRTPVDAHKAARVSLTVRMVRSAAYHFPGKASCLEKALALWWLLGRRGIASSVRIGTRKVDDKFEAHAWVDCDGVALNEPEELHSHYAAFDEAFPVREAEEKTGKPPGLAG
jgi:Transglutaminase-like superfamily